MTPTPAPDSDPDLQRRLRDALRDEADSVSPSPDAWTDFMGQLPDASAALSGTPQANGADVGETDTVGAQALLIGAAHGPRRSSRAWRLPLVAAAAVVAIAIVAGLAVHRSRSGDAARQSPAACGSAAMLWVPVDGTGGVQVSPGNGQAATSSDGAPSASGTGTLTSTAALGLGFGGNPPTSPLCMSSVGPGAAPLGAVRSDGTALGYLSMLRVGSERLLVAAVGPGVAQVQIQAMPSAAVVRAETRSWASMMTASTRVTTDIDPGFTIASEMWIIDGGDGTPWSDAGTTTRWTSLGDGWHGFALAVPDDAVTADATTLGANGAFTQGRRIDLITGATSDQAPPVRTAIPSGWAESPSARSSPVSGSKAGSQTATAPSSVPAGSTSVASPGATGCARLATGGLGLSDVGFDLAGVEFGAGGAGGLCFLDLSSRIWTHADARSAPITAAGITGVGTIVNQSTGTGTTGRIVWGAISPAVSTVAVTSPSGSTVNVGTGLISLGAGDARVFLFTAPSTGPVTITAEDAGGTSLDTLTLG